MSFSDEPKVIPTKTRSKKRYFLIGGVVLFVALLASVALFPQILDFQRHNTPIGPHEGSVHRISFGGDRYSLELARPEAFDYRLAVVIEPLEEGIAWQPEEHRVRVRWEGLEEEPEVLEWIPEEGFFGFTEGRFHPRSDFRFEIELIRGETIVWKGQRWSFRLAGGHAH